MAKSKKAASKARSAKPEQRVGPFQSAGKKLDESAPIRTAEEVLEQARAKFEEAREQYESLRAGAKEGVESLREKNVGDLIDGTLQGVRKHPGRGLFAALGIGFVLGRLFRR